MVGGEGLPGGTLPGEAGGLGQGAATQFRAEIIVGLAAICLVENFRAIHPVFIKVRVRILI